MAAPPQWVRDLARVPVPAYDAETNGVVLLDEHIVNVAPNGDMHTIHRYAVRILREKGSELGTMRVYFDSDTKLTYYKGWTITSGGQEYV
jgi:hypothetical protein